jgi:hypothetical protein
MLVRRATFGLVVVVAGVALATAAPGAFAHGAEAHAASPTPTPTAGAQGALPPVVGGGTGGAQGAAPAAPAAAAAGAAGGGGAVNPAAGAAAPAAAAATPAANAGGAAANPNAPAAGAQPAAPTSPQNPVVAPIVAGDDEVIEPVDDGARADADDTPIESTATPDTSKVDSIATPVMTVDGGGGNANVAPAADPATPSGALPFTGVEENILLISLAGMLAPIGVLLWCAARRGDRRRHLAMPRFQWADSPRLDRYR